MHARRASSQREFGQHQTLFNDLRCQRSVSSGVDQVQTGADDGDGVGACLCRHTECPFVCRAVDTQRQPRDDDEPLLGQLGCKSTGVF